MLKKQNYIIVDFASNCNVDLSPGKNTEKISKINFLNKIILSKTLKRKFLKKYIYISTPEIFGSS